MKSKGRRQIITARSRIRNLGLIPWSPPKIASRDGQMNHMIGSVVDICTKGTKSSTWPGKLTKVYLGRVGSWLSGFDYRLKKVLEID